eukprot:7443395-Pyramimonas_sp.AAC.1
MPDFHVAYRQAYHPAHPKKKLQCVRAFEVRTRQLQCTKNTVRNATGPLLLETSAKCSFCALRGPLVCQQEEIVLCQLVYVLPPNESHCRSNGRAQPAPRARVASPVDEQAGKSRAMGMRLGDPPQGFLETPA